MRIEIYPIKVRDIVEGYADNGESGVVGYNGKLNIRPKFQREFVYKDKQRDAVIETIMKGFPLNVMYWARNADGTFELLDGQQRTISFCQYVSGKFSINEKYFFNLTDSEQTKILDYELYIYVCEGNDDERLDWFRTINIAGERLTEQELLNAQYTGKWLEDAKSKFSKTDCIATQIQKNFQLVSGNSIRQEVLETALKWINDGNVADYMALHQHDGNANALWLHFNSVVEWAKAVFPNYRKEMRGLEWGRLYKEYGYNYYDVEDVEREVSRLMGDEDVTSKKGVFEYVLSGMRADKERLLSIRCFSDKDKRTAYERQSGICPICNERHDIKEMQADHIIEWCNGGKTTLDNIQMVCHACHKKLTKTMTA